MMDTSRSPFWHVPQSDWDKLSEKSRQWLCSFAAASSLNGKTSSALGLAGLLIKTCELACNGREDSPDDPVVLACSYVAQAAQDMGVYQDEARA